MLPVGHVSAGKGGNAGAIWTTSGDCGDASQDVNHFAIGEVVYINGSGFDENTSYNWEIKGQPGSASADPNIVVASGSVMTDADGNFCLAAYTVAADDDGEYSVKVGNKGDNYRVQGSTPPPVDLCPNIEGIQTEIPAGMELNEDGNCVPVTPPADLCPNIEGIQTEIPAGMELNEDGNCVPVTPPADLCPNIEGIQTEIPAGMELNEDGNCVPVTPPADLCPNIEGSQTAIPEGMKVDKDGNCVPLSDPFGLDVYCLGFSVVNLNDFASSFDWEVAGGPSGSVLLEVGESIDIDVDPAFAGATVTISFGDDAWSLSADLPDDCPVPFIDLQIEGYCLATNNASLYGWRVTNPNGYDVDFEWRINGSTLAGLATVDANGIYEFTTPKAEGSILMLYMGGVFQSDTTGAQCTDIPQTVPENIPVQAGGSPVPIPVTGGGSPVLIPVTGVADGRVDLTPRVFMNLGFGFFGLGLVLHGISRRKGVI